MEKLSDLNLAELDALLKQYPWFAFARKMFISRLSEKGSEQRYEALKDALIFFSNPDKLLVDIPQVPQNGEVDGRTVSTPQKVLVVGGDYFTREDFEELGSSDREVIEKFESELAEAMKQGNGVLDEDFEAKYYTETLARIYAQQGLYDKAIEVYEKLILLNPEKSIYFASHIDGLKKNL